METKPHTSGVTPSRNHSELIAEHMANAHYDEGTHRIAFRPITSITTAIDGSVRAHVSAKELLKNWEPGHYLLELQKSYPDCSYEIAPNHDAPLAIIKFTDSSAMRLAADYKSVRAANAHTVG